MTNYNIENPVLRRFIDNLPDYPRCTDSLKAGCRPAPKHVAAKRRYIEPNKRNYSNTYLGFDCDYGGTYYATSDLDLPPETICVTNRTDGKGHINYEWTVPIHLGEHASEKALRYLDVIRTVYTRKLEADPSYGGLLTKNPLSDAWHVYTWNVTYTLDELAEPLRDVSFEQIAAFPDDGLWHEHLKNYDIPLFDRKPRKSRLTSDDPTESLFVYHNTRWYGYTITADCKRYVVLYERIEAYIRKLDRDFSLNLRESQIRADTRSIAKWCWNHRADFIAKRNAFCDIQRERAYGSHKARKRNTSAKISKARQALRRQGKLITKSALAEVSGLDKKTVLGRRIKTDLTEAHRSGAYRTNEIRKAMTETGIKQAIEQALREGIKPTQANITKLSGIGIATVKRRWSEFKHLLP